MEIDKKTAQPHKKMLKFGTINFKTHAHTVLRGLSVRFVFSMENYPSMLNLKNFHIFHQKYRKAIALEYFFGEKYENSSKCAYLGHFAC